MPPLPSDDAGPAFPPDIPNLPESRHLYFGLTRNPPPMLPMPPYGAPWTVKTAVVPVTLMGSGGPPTVSAFGFVHGPASNTSSTAKLGGVVQLVTSATIVSTLGGSAVWPMLGTLNIHFVPEPEAVLLFGAGITAMGIAVRRRAKR